MSRFLFVWSRDYYMSEGNQNSFQIELELERLLCNLIIFWNKAVVRKTICCLHNFSFCPYWRVRKYCQHQPSMKPLLPSPFLTSILHLINGFKFNLFIGMWKQCQCHFIQCLSYLLSFGIAVTIFWSANSFTHVCTCFDQHECWT